MEAYLIDWLNLLVRWLHVIAGIAWIGASFYFVMLDNSLSPPKDPADAKRGVSGELWAVHGGGFYCSQKFPVGPRGEPLSENLHWSKWEAYTTWLSGMALMAIVYWHGANTYLIDRNVLALSPAAAIGISIGSIVAGWLVYDALCRLLTDRDGILAALVFIVIMLAAWGLFQVFGARAAFLHVGAIMGTIMVANVAHHIIPGQRRMVADIRAGRAPDPQPGIIGKQRSVHNTYFTLPVLFIMISGHYPMTYSHPLGWLVLGVLMAAGVLIRQYFVLRHKGAARPWLLAVAVLLLAGLIVWLAPSPSAGKGAAADFGSVRAVLERRCVNCHAEHPRYEGFAQPPKGVMLETPEQIAQHAAKIAETVGNRYMPIGNLTQMTDGERAIVAQWFAAGAKTH
ncbi:MAG: urate hydroxylase PuuD [Betaproteobacteria bacterium]|nr:urate hydroxylase PuuD [Betaproteobacteria bacterium]